MVIQSSPPIGREPAGLRDIAAMLRRRSLLLGLFAAAGLGAGFAIYAGQPRLYRAEAVMAFDVRRIQGMPIDQVVTPLAQENPVLRTELDMIGSRVMAERVIGKLMAEGPIPILAEGANPLVSGSNSVAATSSGSALATGLRRLLGPNTPGGEPTAAQEDRLRSGLKVVNDGRSYTIYIAYTADDPAVAARVANAYALAYLAYQDDVQIDATRRVSDWLSDRLKVLAARLEQAEQGAERYRASSGLLEIEGVTLAAQRLSALNTELMAARAAHATAEAREKTATRLAANSDGLDSFTEVLGSPIIQQLRASQAQFERRLRVLNDTGAGQSAEIPALASELDAVRQQIAQEVDHILVSLRNEIDAAAGRVAALEAELRIAQTNYGASDMARVKLEALVREANADRAIYESLLGRSKQMVDQNGLVDPGVRLISEATVPSRPSGLRLPHALLLGLLTGVAGGLGIVLILERLDDRVRSRRAIEAATGLPVLATIPILPWRFRRDAARLISQTYGASIGEAFASLQWMLRLSPATRKASVFVVTSALPKEGKTTLALALARSMALAGRAVVLVDADLHRQSLGRMAKLDRQGSDRRGLGAYLAGEANIDDILTPDPASPLQIVAALAPAECPQDRLGSSRMADLIAGLRERFDLVILDAPPVLTSSDAAQIGAHVDAILFVTRWGSTTYEAVLSALQKLALCGLTAPSLILNGVERRAHQSYEAPRPLAGATAASRTNPARFDHPTGIASAQMQEG